LGKDETVKWEAEIQQKDYELLTEQYLKDLIENREKKLSTIEKNMYSDSKEKAVKSLNLLRDKLEKLELARLKKQA
jgi:hypothetical protein